MQSVEHAPEDDDPSVLTADKVRNQRMKTQSDEAKRYRLRVKDAGAERDQLQAQLDAAPTGDAVTEARRECDEPPDRAVRSRRTLESVVKAISLSCCGRRLGSWWSSA